MDINSIVIITGLIAALVVYAAVQDSWNGWEGTVGPMTWSLSGSWSTTAAAIVAIALLFVSGGGEEFVFSFGALLLFGPLIYSGFGKDGVASKSMFFVAATLITWATFTLLAIAAAVMPEAARQVSIVPRMLLGAAVIATLLAAIANASRALTKAASTNGSEGWTLP